MAKRQIRYGVFETNSSMTHALTICTEEEYNKWRKGELIYDDWDNKLVEVPADYDEDEDEDWQYQTYGAYQDSHEYCEDFKKNFTTPSGDNMVAFGYYGHD